MQDSSIFQSPSTWVIAGVLAIYAFILLRSLFIFFFMGGRQRMLQAEKNLSGTLKQREAINGVVKKMCKGKKTGCDKKADAQEVHCGESPEAAEEREEEDA